MTALLVLLLFAGFAVVDILVRVGARRLAQARARREREAILATSVRLDFTQEAPTLKRVEVPDALARILAVDDEPIVLDSFRKILVLAGFSVDTVESGPEALGLVQRRDYDFVFTDLKMPGMDGVEVVKAVHHLRPDVDIAVITGYGTIESAVETMQHGAVDYVQKPFTEEELVAFARRLLLRRQARLERERRPSVRLVAPALADAAPGGEYRVPGGVFLSEGHTWARIEPDGNVRVGLDDFARRALGPIERVEAAARGTAVRRGETLFTVRSGNRAARLPAPLSGRVVRVHEALARDGSPVSESPYERGWVVVLEPANLARELPGLRIGGPVVAWYQEEIARLRQMGEVPEDWSAFESEFLRARTATPI